jgi:hypothetical protein
MVTDEEKWSPEHAAVMLRYLQAMQERVTVTPTRVARTRTKEKA